MSLPVVRLGFAAPLTGPQAIVGNPMRACAQLAVDEANGAWEDLTGFQNLSDLRSGKLPFRVELRAEDDEATPDGARAVATRFIADEALLGVVGHKNSGPSAAAAPLYAAANLAQVTPSSTNSALSRQGHSTFFRVCAHDAIQGQVAARYAVRVLEARRVAVLHDYTDYGHPLAQVFAETAGHEGARVSLFEGVQEGGDDFSAIVARLVADRPDLVYFGLTEIESSKIARQLRQAGAALTLFGTDGSPESQFLPLAGEAAEGVYQTYAGTHTASTPSAQPFVQRFRARYGEPPVYGAEVYDATWLLILAAARAAQQSQHGPLTRQVVLETLRELDDFAGATGPLSFDAHGDRVEPTITLWRVEGGHMRLLGSASELLGHHLEQL